MNTDRCIVLQNRDNTVTVTPVGARCMQWTHHPSGAQIFHCDSEPILSGIPISRQFLAGENGTVVLLDTKTGLSVTYTPDPHLRYRLIFSAGRDYLCIEPQTCAVNAVNLPPDSPDAEYPVLSAGASATYVSFISAAYHA